MSDDWFEYTVHDTRLACGNCGQEFVIWAPNLAVSQEEIEDIKAQHRCSNDY